MKVIFIEKPMIFFSVSEFKGPKAIVVIIFIISFVNFAIALNIFVPYILTYSVFLAWLKLTFKCIAIFQRHSPLSMPFIVLPISFISFYVIRIIINHFARSMPDGAFECSFITRTIWIDPLEKPRSFVRLTFRFYRVNL